MFIVEARSDGRGGIRPFNAYTKKEAGATVHIGDKQYKVTKDGRVNIPKSIFDKYGVIGDNGRKRIGIQFATDKNEGKDRWKTTKAKIITPPSEHKNAKTYDIVKVKGESKKRGLVPSDSPDFNWSPR